MPRAGSSCPTRWTRPPRSAPRTTPASTRSAPTIRRWRARPSASSSDDDRRVDPAVRGGDPHAARLREDQRVPGLRGVAELDLGVDRLEIALGELLLEHLPVCGVVHVPGDVEISDAEAPRLARETIGWRGVAQTRLDLTTVRAV